YQDLVEVAFFFVGGRHVGADHVAEIADEIARHYGIEVDDADTFSVFIEKDVADLCVVMRDPDAKFWIVADCFEVGYDPFVLLQHGDLARALLPPTRVSFAQRLLELPVPQGKVVEIGYGGLERMRVKPGKKLRELSELPRRLVRLFRVRNGMEGHGVFYEGH